MSIQKGIRTPGMYTDVNINTQRTGLPANTHKVLFITNDDQPDDSSMPISIYDKSKADANFGVNSEAGRMITAAIKTNSLVDVQCLGSTITPQSPISCVGAISEAVLISTNLPSDLANPPTVNIYVNSVLISKNVSTNYINQQWFTNPLLSLNASQLGYSVIGDSSHQEYFHNSSNSPITFEFVPNSDGLYDGVDYLAKDALIIGKYNNNPTAYKDPTTGTISFCLAAGG